MVHFHGTTLVRRRCICCCTRKSVRSVRNYVLISWHACLIKHCLIQILYRTLVVRCRLLWVEHLWTKHFVEKILARLKQFTISKMRWYVHIGSLSPKIMIHCLRYWRALPLLLNDCWICISHCIIFKYTFNYFELVLLFNQILLYTLVLNELFPASFFLETICLTSLCRMYHWSLLFCDRTVIWGQLVHNDAISVGGLVDLSIVLFRTHLPLITIL